jgi:hypothetical protein
VVDSGALHKILPFRLTLWRRIKKKPGYSLFRRKKPQISETKAMARKAVDNSTGDHVDVGVSVCTGGTDVKSGGISVGSNSAARANATFASSILPR